MVIIETSRGNNIEIEHEFRKPNIKFRGKFFDLKDKTEKIKNQNKVYNYVRNNGLYGGDVFSIPGHNTEPHYILNEFTGDSNLLFAELQPEIFNIIKEKLIRDNMNDKIIAGCGDFYDVFRAFCNFGYVKNKIIFLDLDIYVTSKSLIENVTILEKISKMFSSPYLSDKFAISLTYLTQGSNYKYHDRLYFGIQNIAKTHSYIIPNNNCYFEEFALEKKQNGERSVNSRTIFGVFVKDTHTRQFPGFFRNGESFIIV